MSRLPEPIDLELENWEGYKRDKFQEELVQELVQKYNDLLQCVEEIMEPSS